MNDKLIIKKILENTHICGTYALQSNENFLKLFLL